MLEVFSLIIINTVLVFLFSFSQKGRKDIMQNVKKAKQNKLLILKKESSECQKYHFWDIEDTYRRQS